MEKIKGKSENSIIYIYEGYTYNIDKRLQDTYRCSTRRTTGCRGLAKIGEDKVTINPSHNHAPDNLRIQKYVLKQEMLRLSRETLQPPKDIFDDVSRRNPESAVFVAFKSIRSQLNRERIKNRPKLPQSIDILADELNNYIPISDIYKGSVTANDGNKALFFSNDKLLQALNSSTEIFCDGTFSVVPRVPSLSQLYTIHIRYMDKVLAVIFILCEARTASLYEKIWSKIIELVPNLLINIKFIMTDYECAAMNAMEKYFPNATIHGCWFHLNQALQRKWNHLGLSNSSNIILPMAMTIPLLPEQYFTQAYHILCNTCEENNPDYEKLKEFLTYFEKTWLSKASKVSVYKCPVRTNNAVESFHNVINRKLGAHHPHVWLFLGKLQ
ncbi:FLYWCH-type domain-containing protein [Camponotus japonicus]